LARVRREDFIPDRVWIEEESGYVAIDRSEEPHRWEGVVYANRVVVTQFDDGDTMWPAVGRRPTCSASMPSAVVGMLDALDVRQGQRVLEIGAGTGGTTAALLPLLPAESTDYVYSDISSAFLAAAEERFARFPFVSYRVIDIERSPQMQGLSAGSFDIVLAANVYVLPPPANEVKPVVVPSS